ncbi:21557_t:CDS:2, partial [Rhizophagus irregularis]
MTPTDSRHLGFCDRLKLQLHEISHTLIEPHIKENTSTFECATLQIHLAYHSEALVKWEKSMGIMSRKKKQDITNKRNRSSTTSSTSPSSYQNYKSR